MIVDINNVKVGMILDESIYSDKSHAYPLVTAGSTLTKEHIYKIKCNRINFVKVRFQKEVDEVISDDLERSLIKSLKEFDIKSTLENAKKLVGSISSANTFSYSLSKYYENDKTVYNHAVNVASFATAIAKVYNASQDNPNTQIDLEQVAVSALLHDIGKFCKDPDILKNIPSIMLPEEKFPGFSKDYYDAYNKEMYPLYGYTMLNEYIEVSNVTKLAILLMRENELGTGPLKVDGNYIESNANSAVIISKIINVADWYEVLIERIVSLGISPLNVIEIMNQLAFSKIISKEFCEILMSHVPLFSLGSLVVLSTGEIAKVVEINKDLARPVVQTVDSNEIINLADATNIIINKVVDIDTIYSLREKQTLDEKMTPKM